LLESRYHEVKKEEGDQDDECQDNEREKEKGFFALRDMLIFGAAPPIEPFVTEDPVGRFRVLFF
jgi:hypothetical protein